MGFATTALGTPPSDRPPPTIVRDGEEPEDTGPDPMIGQVLSGLYRVENRIGEGGMGAVYMAIHIHLNKPFAVKVLSEKVAANRQAVDRLKQEAQLASKIEHDNIIDVINFDATPDGRVFLVMEMLKGTSLAEVVEKGQMTLQRALPIAYQVCDALQAAHQAGIVHRDLKPENVFIVRKADADFVKVLDFGISKIKSAEAEQVRMTKTGQLVGTPLYMSPEQAKGETDVDHRSDIYSLGVMLYEMLCAKPPFEGGNYFQLLWKHGNEPAESPAKYRKDLPDGVCRALLRCLEKEPAARFQSMAELKAALMAAAPNIGAQPERLVSFGPGDLPVAAPAGRSKLLIGVAAAVVAATITGLIVSRTSPPPVAASPTASVTVETPPVLAPEPEVAPEVAPEAATPAAALPIGVEPPSRQVAVRFDTSPAGARVLIDGQERGQTPCAVELEFGQAVEARIVLPDHVPVSTEIVPEEGLEIRHRLRRRPSATMEPTHFKMGF